MFSISHLSQIIVFPNSIYENLDLGFFPQALGVWALEDGFGLGVWGGCLGGLKGWGGGLGF